MLRLRRKSVRKKVINETTENEIPAVARLKKRKIKGCERKLRENAMLTVKAKKRIQKLNILIKKHDNLDRNVSNFYRNYTALLEKTLRDLNNLKALQINRETEMLNKLKELEESCSLYKDKKTSSQPDINDRLKDIGVNNEEETLNTVIAFSDKKFADLQMSLEGNRIDEGQVEVGKLILETFLNFRKELHKLKAKLIEYADLVEDERQRLCLVKCLRMKREIDKMGEVWFLSDVIKCRGRIKQDLEEQLTKLPLKKFRKLCNPLLHQFFSPEKDNSEDYSHSIKPIVK